LLGHHHPEIASELRSCLHEQIPFSSQLSSKTYTDLLAQRLSESCKPIFSGKPAIAVFGSTGAEAVEIALKHSALCKQRQIEDIYSSFAEAQGKPFRSQADENEIRSWLSNSDSLEPIDLAGSCLEVFSGKVESSPYFAYVKGSYHGKTLGALSVTSASSFRADFERLLNANLELVPDVDLYDQLCSQLFRYPVLKVHQGLVDVNWKTFCPLASVIVEPIQGEGGIFELGRSSVEGLNRFVSEASCHLLLDEVQTGLGRTGHFFAGERLGLKADAIVLGKSLGGGLAKISACLFKDSVYQRKFDFLHSSTFAEDEISSRLALKTLQIIERDRLAEHSESLGKVFEAELVRLAEAFPDIVAAPRGAGLLWGLEFKDRSAFCSNGMRVLFGSGYFGYMISSFLLSRGWRVAPSLSHTRVLRFEPSVQIKAEDIRSLVAALRDVCFAIRYNDVLFLMQHLCSGIEVVAPREELREIVPSSWDEPKCQNFISVGFVAHLLSYEDLIDFEPSFSGLSKEDLYRFYSKWNEMLDPVVMQKIWVPAGPEGLPVLYHHIGIIEGPEVFDHAISNRKFKPLRERVQQAVDLAVEAGCEVVGLGALTSVVTNNGKALYSRGSLLTTGNSLTVASSVHCFESRLAERQISIEDSTVTILGASGNIGSAILDLLWGRVKQLNLVTSERSYSRLLSELESKPGDQSFSVAKSLADFSSADAMICCSNSVDPVVREKDINKSVKVILDIATPGDVEKLSESALPELDIIEGGLMKVPGCDDFRIMGVSLPRGFTFACISETMIMGMMGVRQPLSFGKLNREDIHKIWNLAVRAGFKIGDYKSKLGMAKGFAGRDLSL
ncbi:MAG: aminotransferase class III-fold pyridoxal phosphate-dependent enzyme, partial [Pseudomonadota bacterium]